MPEKRTERIEVIEKDGTSVVRFRDAKILEDRAIHQMGTELLEVVQGKTGVRLILDFTGVKYLSSAALGKLITVRRRVDQLGGKLLLCELGPETLDVFKIAKLDDYFEICRDQRSALEQMK
ncbi:MAG: STAS domain-containing protein [Planctomycetes bacterium]|nr:STAS domain-containing protein [Planctomycetota bacterium]